MNPLDAPNDLQIIFANRVIRQFADNMLGAETKIEGPDFRLIRVVFRHLGGSWASLMNGDIKQLTLLEALIRGWGAKRA